MLQNWDATSLRTVLESTADPNCTSAAGWTPLILCSMADRSDLCSLLLDFKADPFKTGPRGRSAMLWADWYHSSGALALLKAERRERREDREGLKRLQQALKERFHLLLTCFQLVFFGFWINFGSFWICFHVFTTEMSKRCRTSWRHPS